MYGPFRNNQALKGQVIDLTAKYLVSVGLHPKTLLKMYSCWIFIMTLKMFERPLNIIYPQWNRTIKLWKKTTFQGLAVVLPKILQDFSVPKSKVSTSPENFKFEKKRNIKPTDTFDMISNWFSSVSSLDNNLSSCMNPYKDLYIIKLQIYDNVNMACTRFLPELQKKLSRYWKICW